MISVLRILLVVLAIITVTGCTDNPATPSSATPRPATGIAQPVQATREIVVGPNRFVFGLVDSGNGQPIPDVPEVSIQFFKVHPTGPATKVGDASVVYHNEKLPAGLFVAYTTFDTPGAWGALFTITPPGRVSYQVKTDFTVAADSPVPNVGRARRPVVI